MCSWKRSGPPCSFMLLRPSSCRNVPSLLFPAMQRVPLVGEMFGSDVVFPAYCRGDSCAPRSRLSRLSHQERRLNRAFSPSSSISCSSVSFTILTICRRSTEVKNRFARSPTRSEANGTDRLNLHVPFQFLGPDLLRGQTCPHLEDPAEVPEKKMI